MKIEHIRLEKLAAFLSSGIDSLDVTFTELLQIILGTNGSGKSHLLRQLTPLPPSSKEFLENGYKEITITHQGNTYTLISDFSEKDGAHRFHINGGPNINEGRTTEGQSNLIADHLGVTKKVDALLHVAHSISMLPPGMRKALFVENNPANLSFIIEDHQRVKKHLRGIVANLTMLHGRKAELGSMLLDESILDSLKEEHKRLNDDTMANVGFIGSLKTLVSTLPSSQSLLDFRGIPVELDRSIDQWYKDLKRNAGLYLRVARATRDQRYGELLQEIATTEAQIDGTRLRLEEAVQELNTLTENLNSITAEDAATEVRLKIGALEEELSSLQTQITEESPWSGFDLHRIESGIKTLSTLLHEFLDCPVVIPTLRQFHLRKSLLNNCIAELNAIKAKSRIDEARMQRIQASQTIRMSDLPQDNCAKTACPLYAHFLSGYEQAKSEFLELKTQCTIRNKRALKLERFIELRTLNLDSVSPYMDRVQKLHEILRSNPWLHEFFVGIDVPQTLRLNPLRFTQLATKKLEQSKLVVRREKRLSELKNLTDELAKCSDLSEGEILRLKERVSYLTALIKTLRVSLHQGERQSVSLSTEKYGITQLNEQITEAESIIRTFDLGIKETIHYHERGLYEELIKKLEDLQSRSLTRIGEISVTIREQESLRARYEEEVVKQIEKLTTEKKEWEDLEKALLDIPRMSMISYLNAIIGIANAYIASVFTYDLTLTPLTPDSKLDYKLSVNVSGISIPDISTCSKAQKEVIDLSLTLAIRKLSGLDDYPIYLDEVGASFDNVHKQRLIDLLTYVIEEHRVSQMFLVNHHAAVHEGLANNETLILNEANVVAPLVFNQHAEFNKDRPEA